jgi:hypothetical protein
MRLSIAEQHMRLPFLDLDLDLINHAASLHLHAYLHMMRIQAVTTPAQPCLLPR